MASNNQSSTPSSSSEEVVWYFAFGSNMASRVLIGRRQVQPMESHPCVVEGYDLVFNMRGLPFFEPAFASIIEKQDAVCHGVVHKITRKQMDHIRLTEGGSGHDNIGYKEIIVDAKIYDPHYSPSEDESQKKASTNSMDGVVVKAISLQAHAPDIENALPSNRYLTILREGAREYGLAPVWQNHLLNVLQPYKNVGGLSLQNFGRFSFALCILPIFILPALVMLSTHILKIQPPYFFALYMKWASTLLWVLHDYIWAPIFGSGKQNEQNKKRE